MKIIEKDNAPRNRIRPLIYLKRFIVLMIMAFVPVVVTDFFLDGFYISDWLSLFLFVFILGLLNTFIWPLISKLAFPFVLATLGFGSLILNGIFIAVASYLIKGVSVGTITEGIAVTLSIIVVTMILNLIFSVDDDYSYYRYVLNRTNRKNTVDKEKEKELKNKKPGIIFVEIDGLAYPIIKKAIEMGKMPTLKGLLENGNYKLVHWVTEMASQTSASQAGILLGNNKNVPAFRWVDRKNNHKVVTSSDPDDTPRIEEELSNGEGLLSINGASRVNMYSGDASDTLFTLSKIKQLKNVYNRVLITYFSHPYNFSRTFILFIFEIFLEYRSRLRQKRKHIEPRLGGEKRGGIYPLVRAAMTVFMRDLNTYALINDIYRGEFNVIYSTYAAYDEIAHHSGIEDDDAYKTLGKLDKQFRRLKFAIKEAPRKYNVVLLSDHGQTGGKTFKQRYGYTLGDYVRNILKNNFNVSGYLSNDEGVSNVKAVLSTIIKEGSTVDKQINKALDKLEDDDLPTIKGKDIKEDSELSEEMDERLEKDVIVLASGNLGLIYFKEYKERIDYEEIENKASGFLDDLVKHEGIGFIMVKNRDNHAVVISKDGKHNLTTGEIEGEDPLKPFGKYAKQSVLRIHTFDNCPDILVNSFYDEDNNEGAAFEELIGFHGGLGGTQNLGFVMYPSDQFEFPKEEVYGAESLYHIFKQWLDTVDKKSL